MQAFWDDDSYPPHQAAAFNANFGLPGVVRLENLVRPSLLHKHRDLTEDLVPLSSLLDVLKGDSRAWTCPMLKVLTPLSVGADVVDRGSRERPLALP